MRAGPLDTKWGAPSDDTDDLLGVHNVLPRTGRAEVVDYGHDFSTLRFRLYWQAFDNQAYKLLGESASDGRVHRLGAVDIIVVLGVESGEHHVLVTSRNRAQMNRHILPALRSLYGSVDESSTVYADSSPYALGDDDFFRWILAAYHGNQQVSPRFRIPEVRSVSSEDAFTRAAALTNGVESDRADFQAVIVKGGRIGPVKFTIDDADLGLVADLELFEDGGFTVRTTESFYRSGPLDRDVLGPLIVTDLAFDVLPELRAVHAADVAWRSTRRQAYVDDARDSLHRI